ARFGRRPCGRASQGPAGRADGRAHGDRGGRQWQVVFRAPMTDHDDDSAFDERVLVVAPTRRDADVTGSLLGAARVPFVICADMRELAEQLGLGVGAVLVTDQSLGEAGASAFVSALGRQPAWSDVPVLVLTRGRENSPASIPALGLLTNVTL